MPLDLKNLVVRLAGAYEVTPADVVKIAVATFVRDNFTQLGLEGKDEEAAHKIISRVEDYFAAITDNQD
jgi:hypothetical protein